MPHIKEGEKKTFQNFNEASTKPRCDQNFAILQAIVIFLIH